MDNTKNTGLLAKFGVTVAALVVGMQVVGQADAVETHKLTIISGMPPVFTPVGAAIKVFIPKVNEILARSGKYKVSWVQGFSGQIVKPRGELEGVETGLGDIGVVPGPFHPDKLSLYQIGYGTPFTSSDVGVISDAMNHLLDNFPAMGRQVEHFNQIVLRITGGAEDYVLFSKRKLSRFSDFKGIKVGAVGANQPWVAAAGATPVTIKGLPTIYTALKTGIYESAVLWQQAAAAFKLCQVAPHKLVTGFGGIGGIFLSVNKNSWAKLPGEVKAALRQGARAWTTGNNRGIQAGAKWGEGVCQKKYGQTTHVLSPKEQRTWAFALPNIAQAWAKRQDKGGLPGTQMLKTYMDYMRAKKQIVVRNWDRE